MSDLRFRVGASVDSTWDTVFSTILSKAKKARAQIAAEMSQGAKAIGGPYRTAANEAGASFGKVDGAATTAGKAIGRSADGAKDRFDALLKSIKKAPADLAILSREAEKAMDRVQRAQARTALGIPSGGGGGGGKFANRTGYWSMRNFSPVTPTLSLGANIARDIARGAGVDLDLGSQVQKSVERQDIATSLSIQGRKSYAKPGDRNREQVAASTLSAEAFTAGNATGFDPNEILRAQTKFVDLTGDLATARGMMADLGRVSNATGTDLQETATAAAGISRELDASFGSDQAGKAKAMNEILRNLAGQGKEGAVELKQYASQMAKVAAAVSEFGGDRVKAFNLVGMMVQQSRAHGGSTTATQAATSVAAFVRDIAKDASSKHPHLPFIGDVYNRDAQGHRTSLKDGPSIIEAAVLKSHGDPAVLRSWFRNSTSFKAVEGFAGTYRNAERAKPGSGREALEREMSTLAAATISEADVAQANAAKLSEAKGQAQLFNNQLAQITDHMMSEITPAMAKAGPDLIAGAGHVADFVAWAAGHPWEGVAAALGASVAKAGIEQTIRFGVEKAFAASASMPIAIAAAVITASMVYMDAKASEDAGKDHGDTANDLGADNATRLLNSKAPGTATAKEIEDAKKAAAALEGTVARDKQTSGALSSVKGFELGLASVEDSLGAPWAKGGEQADRSQFRESAEHLSELKAIRRAIERQGVGGGGSGAPSVDSGARVSSVHGPFRGGYR